MRMSSTSRECMASELPETITIAKTIPSRVHDDYGSVVVGDSRLDDQGRWIVGLGIHDAGGDRDVDVQEGDTFEFAGAMWKVTQVREPTTATRGRVATLTKVS